MAMDELVSWVVSNGGSLHSSVRLASDQASGTYLQVQDGVEQLEEGTCVVSCPHSLTLSYLNALSFFPFESHSCQFPKSLLEALPSQPITVFFLCQQYLLGADSFWSSYIKSLPQPTEDEKLGTPLWFSDVDWTWLRGTNMEKGYADRQSEWRKLWEEGVSILKDEGWATVGYTWVLAKWAATILSSRSFISSLLVEIISDDHPTGQWNLAPKADGPFPVLFPLIDILNHRPKAKVSWETGREFMGLVIGEELHSGDLVWNNYGPKSNEELLLGYGFCLPSNPFDQVAIKLNMPSNPNHSAIRNQQSSYINSIVSPNETPPDGYYYIRSPDHYTSGYENVSAELRAFPPSLIDNLSILVANDREMGLLQKRPNLHWPTLNGGRRNMLALICQLLQVLQRKYNEITWFDHLLPKDPTNDKQRNAKIYRDSQISIIRAAINPLMYKLRGAVEIGDHGEVIPQLVTLEKALKYLKSLDKVTYTSFRRGLKLALGTNDIRELREACWAEGVWTLWICTIRLWFLRQASAIRINSTVEAKEPLRTKLIDWIRFTDDLQYWSSDPLFDVTATESANDDEAAAELLSVVKSAAEADPSSVFAERIWDLTFIKRGNRIGMEEGLTLALQEQDTEVGEQYVLHLEKRKLQTNTLHG